MPTLGAEKPRPAARPTTYVFWGPDGRALATVSRSQPALPSVPGLEADAAALRWLARGSTKADR